MRIAPPGRWVKSMLYLSAATALVIQFTIVPRPYRYWLLATEAYLMFVTLIRLLERVYRLEKLATAIQRVIDHSEVLIDAHEVIEQEYAQTRASDTAVLGYGE